MKSKNIILVAIIFILAWVGNAWMRPIQDHRRWEGSQQGSFVASECNAVIPVSSTTLAAFGCVAYINDSGQIHGVEQAAQSVGPFSGGDGTYWVGIRYSEVTACPAGWTCQAGDNYMWIKSATKPAVPATGMFLFKATVATVITALEHQADRILSSTFFLTKDTTVGRNIVWTFNNLGMIDCGVFIFFFNGEIRAGRNQQIFTSNCQAGEVEFGYIGDIHVDWWGVTTDDETVDNFPAFEKALTSIDESLNEAGGTINLNRAEYWVATQIDWEQQVNLRGVSMKGSKIRCKGAIICIQFKGVAPFDEFRSVFRDVSIKGEDVPAAAPAIVQIDDVQDLEFNNVNVRGSTLDCYNISGDSTNIRIIGGSTEQCGVHNINASLTQFILMGHAATATADVFADTTLLTVEGGKSVILANRFEGTGNGETCMEFVGSVNYTLIAGNRFETCTTEQIVAAADTEILGVTIQNNNIAAAGSAPRIDFGASGVTCDGVIIDGNRFDQDQGATIFKPSVDCISYRVVNNTTDISAATWVLGAANNVKHRTQWGETADEIGIIENTIMPLTRAEDEACATSLSARDGSFLFLDGACGGAIALTAITNGYFGQIIVISGLPNTNFTIADQPDINLSVAFEPDSPDDTLMLINVDGSNNWVELSRSDNG
jgi:hypothetical protein